MANRNELRDAYGDPIKQGVYVDTKAEDPGLHYAFVIIKKGEGFSFEKDCFPPMVPCLSQETQSSWSEPMTPALRETFLQRHGKDFLTWLERQKTKHPEVIDLEQLAQSSPK